jgi:hypothetical protein
MSAPRDAAWLHVCKLNGKGITLFHSGHAARAANKFGDALAAARALGEEDCLVAANLALHRAQCLLLHAIGADVSPAAKDAAHEEAYKQILPALMQTLARRAAARTLLEGTVRPHEMAWYCAHVEHLVSTFTPSARGDAQTDLAPHVGYVAFVFAAGLALNHVRCTHCAPAIGARDFQLRMELICEALTLMAAPRRSGANRWLDVEASFVGEVQEVVDSGAVKADTAHGASAWCNTGTVLAHWPAHAQLEASEACEAQHRRRRLTDASARARRASVCVSVCVKQPPHFVSARRRRMRRRQAAPPPLQRC